MQRQRSQAGTGQTIEHKLLERALWYASVGIPVFPIHAVRNGRCTCGRKDCVRNAGKHPRTAHGFLDATTHEPVIRNWWQRWPGANIGIPTGSPSGWLVIDIDPRNGGTPSWSGLIRKYGPLPHGAEQVTGGGGKHLVFRFVPDIRSGVLAAGVDYKGAGGYIIASPSVHATGRPYRWCGPNWWNDLLDPSDAPDWLLTCIKSSRNGVGSIAGANQHKQLCPNGRSLTRVVGGAELNRTPVGTYYAARVPSLKQTAAKQWRGPCPIHRGSKNSFVVDSRTGLWYCFADCKRGGAMLDLEMTLTGASSTQAAQQLARITEACYEKR